jgi:hypothetical protein
MKCLKIAILTIAASCGLSHATVTFTGILQGADGVNTNSPLQDRLGTAGSTHTVSGLAVETGTAYSSVSFTLDLVAAAGSPTPGDVGYQFDFFVASDMDYTFSGGGSGILFGSSSGVLGASGTLTNAETYTIFGAFSGGPVVSANETLSLTITPEPSMALLGALGLLGLLRRRR